MSNYPSSTSYSSTPGATPSWSNPQSSWMNPWFPSTSTGGMGGNWPQMQQPWGGFGGGYGSGSQMTPYTGAGPMSTWGGEFGGDFDRMMRSFEQQWWNMQRQMERSFRNMDRRMERAFSSELNFQPSRPASMLEHYSLMNPIRMDAEGNRWLNVYFDLRSYKPEEVNVSLDTKNRCIQVEASHEVKESKEHYIKRHYSRKVYLPEDLKIDLSKIEVKSCLTNEGLLCVEAPLPKLSIEEARSQSAASKTVSTTGGATTVYPITVKTV